MSGKKDHNIPAGDNFPENGSNGSYNSSQYNGYAPVSDEDEIGARELFYMLWHHKWIIAGSILLCTVLAFIIAASMTPIYRSYGTLMISQPQNGYTNAGGGLSDLLSSTYGIGMGSSIENELLILKSRHLSRELADTLMELETMPNGKQFPVLYTSYPGYPAMTGIDTVAYRLRENLAFSRINREADLVKISYSSPSPVEAAFIVNMTMEIYSQLSMRQSRKAASAAVAFLEKERRRIKQELNAAEDRLNAFMNQENIVQVDSQTDALIERMAELEAKKQEAKVKLVAANAAIEKFSERLNNIKPGLADQLIRAVGAQLERLQYKLADLKIEKQILLSNYPDLTARSNPPQKLTKLNSDIAYFKNQIRNLTSGIINKSSSVTGLASFGNIGQNISELSKKLIGLKVEQQQYQAQIETIEAQLSEMNTFFQNLPDNMTELARLKRNMKINEQLYLTITQQYAEMSLWQQTQFGSGRIIDAALITAEPVKPNTLLYMLVGFVIGSIIGVGYVFVKEAFDNSVNSVEKLKSLDVPLLALVPHMGSYIKKEHNDSEKISINGFNISAQLITAHDTNSPISESFRRLESNIIHSSPDTNLKTIIVTSTTKGEGKTTVISNLGVILAESNQKIVLVETDLRRPHLHNMFGMKRSPGLMNLLFENTSMDEAIHSTPIPNLSLLPAGYIPPNQAAVMKSSAFANTLEELKNHYDYVLLDTAPYGIITDASSLIKSSDGVIVCAKFNETLEAQLKNTLDGLKKIRANVLGTVATHFDYTKSTDYAYGNGHYKYRYEDYEAYRKV